MARPGRRKHNRVHLFLTGVEDPVPAGGGSGGSSSSALLAGQCLVYVASASADPTPGNPAANQDCLVVLADLSTYVTYLC